MSDDLQLFLAFVLSGDPFEWDTHKRYNLKKVTIILLEKVFNTPSDKVKYLMLFCVSR